MSKREASEKIDPLFVIFEKHLYLYQDAEKDRVTFATEVVKEYLIYLRKNSITVPRALEGAIVEELEAQVSVMLVKKMYGCLTLGEYRAKVPASDIARAKTKYQKIVG